MLTNETIDQWLHAAIQRPLHNLVFDLLTKQCASASVKQQLASCQQSISTRIVGDDPTGELTLRVLRWIHQHQPFSWLGLMVERLDYGLVTVRVTAYHAEAQGVRYVA